ncbi:MAG: polyprenyl synthetase family protein [Alphaproteobacteria bacterium]|nr:polyprenyl synthetase family protein [Alphaproteobacteria bacterium]
MRYAALGPGKRLRPFLVVASADLFGVEERFALRCGAAVELVHCYSLVHDDLPAMDDDDLRRGRPTVHAAWDEATAILAGDALLTLAFEVLADAETHPSPTVRLRLVGGLARAAGAEGMCGGQMLDMLAERTEFEYGEIARLERMKTGALIAFCCRAGALLGGAAADAERALTAYAQDLGFAFQIADDLIDADGSEEEAGKRLRKDAGQGKATVVSLLGIEAARARAKILSEQAAAHLDCFGTRADPLRDAARFAVERSS